MMNCLFKKSHLIAVFPIVVLLILLAAGPALAVYSGHVASFKSEDNAVSFVNKMKAKGFIAFYHKEDVPGKGEFYRAYIGAYKTRPVARIALGKLKRNGIIDYFQVQNTKGKDGQIAAGKMKTGMEKGRLEEQPVAGKQTVVPAVSEKPETEMIKRPDDTATKPQTKQPEMTPREHFNLGVENIAKGQYEAALDHLNKAIDEDDRFADALNKRCFLYQITGKSNLAIEDCTTAISLRQDFAEAYFNRGLANQADNKIESAIADYGKAISIDGNYEAAYAKRGYLYYMSGKNSQAIADFTTAIRIKPDDDEAYFNRALAHHDSGNADKAVDDIRKACSLQNEQACRVVEDMKK